MKLRLIIKPAVEVVSGRMHPCFIATGRFRLPYKPVTNFRPRRRRNGCRFAQQEQRADDCRQECVFARNALRKAVITIARFERHLKMSADELGFMESGL